MNKNIAIIILALLLIAGAIYVFWSDMDFKDQIKTLSNEIDSLDVDISLKQIKVDSLQGLYFVEQDKVFEISTQLNRLKYRRNEIPDIVDNLDDIELNEFLTAYKSITRN